MSNRRVYLEMLLEKYSKIEPLEKYNKTLWTLRGREFNRYKKDHFMQLTQYDVYKSDLKNSIEEENKNVTPSKWRAELNNINQEYDRVTKQLSDTTVYLAAIEVLEHNRKELNRMLENESHIVRNISKQKEIYPKVKFLSYYSDNNTINLIGIILNLLDEIFILI